MDDLWTGRADVTAALGDATADDACLLVSHNPDLAEMLRDPRVGLMLSGHTHGGQVVFPTGAPFVPSRYGQKYLHGLGTGTRDAGLCVARPRDERRAGPHRQPAGDQPHHAESRVSRRRFFA